MKTNRYTISLVDWDSVKELGQINDVVLAERLGVSKTAVHAARKKRGIPPARVHAHKTKKKPAKKPTKKPAGRVIYVRADDVLHDRLDGYASSESARLGVTVTMCHVVRQALEAYLPAVVGPVDTEAPHG